MTQRLRDWNSLASDHSAAVEQFATIVRELPSDAWDRPVSQGKWTPAEITSHLIESYRILRSELRGGPGMALRLSAVRRWVFRHTVLPRILATGHFPTGARAPRETRPSEIVSRPADALTALSREADAFYRELTERAGRGKVSLTHAYFGPMSAHQSLKLVTVHTRHHGRQIAREDL